MSRHRLAAFTVAAIALAAILLPSPAAAQTGGPYSFYAVTPCRSVDTRSGLGGYTGKITNSQTVQFVVRGTCGIPASATAVSFNVTVADTVLGGWFALYPSDRAYSGISNLNFIAGDTIANGAIVPLASSGTKDVNALAAFAQGQTGGANLILDVTGYFQ